MTAVRVARVVEGEGSARGAIGASRRASNVGEMRGDVTAADEWYR